MTYTQGIFPLDTFIHLILFRDVAADRANPAAPRVAHWTVRQIRDLKEILAKLKLIVQLGARETGRRVEIQEASEEGEICWISRSSRVGGGDRRERSGQTEIDK